MLTISANRTSPINESDSLADEYLPPSAAQIIVQAFGEVASQLTFAPVGIPTYTDRYLKETFGIERTIKTAHHVLFADGSHTGIEIHQIARAHIDATGSFESYQRSDFCFLDADTDALNLQARYTTLEAASVVDAAYQAKTGTPFGFNLGTLPQVDRNESAALYGAVN